jgi:hypothetical protein
VVRSRKLTRESERQIDGRFGLREISTPPMRDRMAPFGHFGWNDCG